MLCNGARLRIYDEGWPAAAFGGRFRGAMQLDICALGSACAVTAYLDADNWKQRLCISLSARDAVVMNARASTLIWDGRNESERES